MSIGDAYATKAELKAYLGQGSSDTTDDGRLDDALSSVSREIEQHCRRQFNSSASATAKLYYPDSTLMTVVDDFSTSVGLIVATDSGNDGTYETTWATTDYQLEPLNGVVDGESGWPYWKLRAVGTQRFPCVASTARAPLSVTAKWGWTAVPAPVKQACLILASETFRIKGAPFGVAGVDQFGPVRVRNNPMAMSKLAPYVLWPVLVG